MYYKCEKCNKLWYYPIMACIFCKEKIKRIIPKLLNVKALTEVNSPSFGHKKVPYYVLLLEDEFGNTHVKKSYKKYEIGIGLDYNEKGKISASTIRYDPYEAIERTTRLLDGFDMDNGTKILIRVDLLDFKFSLLQSLVEFLIDNNIKKESITIIYDAEEENRLLTKFDIGSLGIKTKKLDKEDLHNINLVINLASVDSKKEFDCKSKALYLLFSTLKGNLKNQHPMLFASFNQKILGDAIKRLYQGKDVDSITGEEIEIIKDSLKA